ncbi:MAG: hypothetical protein JXA21_26445 [Anaerolineae bacterium]|nr:hypothetical protein [Anaerolineae bacterium]
MSEARKKRTFNEWLNIVSNFISHYKGFPVLVGIGLIFLNMVLSLLPAWPVVSWFAQTDLLLHLGCIIGLLGILLGDAVG